MGHYMKKKSQWPIHKIIDNQRCSTDCNIVFYKFVMKITIIVSISASPMGRDLFKVNLQVHFDEQLFIDTSFNLTFIE